MPTQASQVLTEVHCCVVLAPHKSLLQLRPLGCSHPPHPEDKLTPASSRTDAAPTSHTETSLPLAAPEWRLPLSSRVLATCLASLHHTSLSLTSAHLPHSGLRHLLPPLWRSCGGQASSAARGASASTALLHASTGIPHHVPEALGLRATKPRGAKSPTLKHGCLYSVEGTLPRGFQRGNLLKVSDSKPQSLQPPPRGSMGQCEEDRDKGTEGGTLSTPLYGLNTGPHVTTYHIPVTINTANRHTAITLSCWARAVTL